MTIFDMGSDPLVFKPSSRARLTDRDLGRFSGRTLFDRLARAVCHAACLPRRELYEAWETARRVRRLFRGGRVVDLCGGHGLLAAVMLVLDDSSPEAVVVDKAFPRSSLKLRDALASEWPRLADRITFLARDIGGFEVMPADLVVSIHACGTLTDRILERAVSGGARVAVLPCCHDFAVCDAGDLSGWVATPLAIDITRASFLKQQGYRVWTQAIPDSITSKNRLLIGAPPAAAGASVARAGK